VDERTSASRTGQIGSLLVPADSLFANCTTLSGFSSWAGFSKWVLRLCLCLNLCTVSLAQQYSPEHPKVQAMVEKGMQFLSSTDAPRSSEYDAGQSMLVGYTCLKVSGDPDHPKTKQASGLAVQLIRSLGGYNARGESKIVYEVAVATFLLASIDAAKYRPELETALSWFESIQKPHGGFGYLADNAGDTSQIQYVILALWTLNEVGISVPPNVIEGVLRYLNTTVRNGGWAYKYAPVAGGGLAPVSNNQPTKSLATAGIGALIIGADILKFYGERKKLNADDEGIPDAFRRIDLSMKRKAERRELTMSRGDIDGTVAAAVRFQNSTQFTGSLWYFYWRYSQERYESFLEIVEGKQSKSPQWYNDGVEELAKLQDPEGSWGKTGMSNFATPIEVDTSFAILFLIRSTQKAIGKLDEGVAYGGYALPNDVSKIKMVGDRIVSDSEASVESLLSMLESDSNNVQIGLLPDDLQLTKDPAQRKEQVSRLARLLVSSRDATARRLAATLIGRSEDLNQVPDLIYGLTDNDPHVPLLAEESLRLLSRKLKSGKLGVDPTPAEKAAAVNYWKSWYLGLRPDYIFIDR